MHVEWFVIFLTVFVSSSYPKIDDEGHFAQIYHGWPVMDTFFVMTGCQNCQTKISFIIGIQQVLANITVNLPN